MSTVTAVNGFTKPALTDAASIETAFTPFADAIDARVNPIFSTTSARDAAIPSPTEGQEAYVTGTKEKYMYNGSKWIGVIPRVIACPADQSVTDSITLTNSTYLVCAVEANASYIVDGLITYTTTDASNGNDFKSAWTIPASAGGYWTALDPAASATSTTNALNTAIAAWTGTTTAGALNGINLSFHFKGILTTGASSGNLQYQFSESTAIGGVTAVTLLNGSWFRILKIG